MRTNIVLTGPKGAGKTTLGRAAAARAGFSFVDLDEAIVQRAGKEISEIVAAEGAEAFRALQAIVCREIVDSAGIVLAVPGRAVLDPADREALAGRGVLICLDVAPAIVARRVAGHNGHPSDGTDGDGFAPGGYERTYADIPLHLDTSDLTIAAAVERVLGLAAGLPEGGHCLPVRDGGTGTAGEEGRTNRAAASVRYEVLIAEGLLEQAGVRLAAAGLEPGRCAVVTNPTVGDRFAEPLLESLKAAGFAPEIFEIPDGEGYKTLDTVATLYARFAEARLARGEPLIALGGGVTGDLGGFAAATWLRGVPFVQVPTTLLSMVDASIGGKVGVDLPAGKNLVGAFKQPALVLIDPETLTTLPGAEFRSGLAEVLKSAIIAAPDLFEQLAGDGPPSLTSMIATTARVKIELVERDPLEAGDRAWLNLGHTFGHALELYSDFTLRHGEAVALGLIAAAELSVALGHATHGLPERIRSVVLRLGLPATYAFDVAQVQALMATDKKRAGRTLRFVLPRRIGEVFVISGVAEDAVAAALRTICAA